MDFVRGLSGDPLWSKEAVIRSFFFAIIVPFYMKRNEKPVSDVGTRAMLRSQGIGESKARIEDTKE
jgi:hypothetical protein